MNTCLNQHRARHVNFELFRRNNDPATVHSDESFDAREDHAPELAGAIPCDLEPPPAFTLGQKDLRCWIRWQMGAAIRL